MASSLISKIKIHKNFPSIDFNAKLSPKSVETQSLFQLVKLKQRRLTSNQIHKQTDINTDPSSGLSKGYPSTENTGVPSESGQGKSSTAQSPSRYQRKRKSISHLQTTQKESKNLAEICQMTPSIDPFEPVRADKALKLDFDNGLTHIDTIKPVTEPFTEGLDLAEKSLNLSLSVIRHELETDQLRTKQEFFEASTVVHNSLELGIFNDHPKMRLSEDFGVMDESPIPEGFLKVNVSNIRSEDMMTEDFEYESIKNLLLDDVGLNLSLSAVHSFLEVNFSNSALRKSFFSQDPNLSAIQNECKSENESSLDVVNDLTIQDFSLNVGLSAVEPEYSMNCKSDREALEVLLEL